jgi:predicted amidohydrolase YtcJ
LRASPADILLLNGRIFTSSDNPSLVQALAIDSDRIAATGSDEEMRERAGAATHEGNLKTIAQGMPECSAYL